MTAEKGQNTRPDKKEIAKAYGKYAKQFTPKPKYFSNSLIIISVFLHSATTNYG